MYFSPRTIRVDFYRNILLTYLNREINELAFCKFCPTLTKNDFILADYYIVAYSRPDNSKSTPYINKNSPVIAQILQQINIKTSVKLQHCIIGPISKKCL